MTKIIARFFFCISKLFSLKRKKKSKKDIKFNNLLNNLVSNHYLDSAISEEWIQNLDELCVWLQKNGFNYFLRNNTVIKTMFVVSDYYLVKEYFYLKNKLKRNFKSIIRESPVGDPYKFFLNTDTSGNLIHLVYHLENFLEESKKQISKYDLIVEFGGGYGRMCKLLFDYGFERSYYIFDLGLFNIIQAYYLENHNKNVSINHIGEDNNHVYCINSIDEVTNINKIMFKKNTLFIATWSYSESPIELRKRFYTIISNSQDVFIGFQDSFSGIDNLTYFKNMMTNTPSHSWNLIPIKHLPGNYYLFGKRY